MIHATHFSHMQLFICWFSFSQLLPSSNHPCPFGCPTAASQTDRNLLHLSLNSFTFLSPTCCPQQRQDLQLPDHAIYHHPLTCLHCMGSSVVQQLPDCHRLQHEFLLLYLKIPGKKMSVICCCLTSLDIQPLRPYQVCVGYAVDRTVMRTWMFEEHLRLCMRHVSLLVNIISQLLPCPALIWGWARTYPRAYFANS